MKKDDDHTYTLALTVRNRPGVLVRCAQVFNRRGHNIESLHVAPAIAANVSTMTITAFGRQAMMDQIVAQLNKLIDVIDVTERESLTTATGHKTPRKTVLA
jgi:acetolactate synthase-1/3 small subunit